jgi:hypothetical protein
VNLAACRHLRRSPVDGVWYRALELQFLTDPLGTKQTLEYPNRFSGGRDASSPFEILFLCEHHVLTLWEVEAMFGSLDPGRMFPNPECAWVIVNVAVHLQAVADLTEESQQLLLGTTAQELTGDWTMYRSPKLAPTQQLGEMLASLSDFEGFISNSAKFPTDRNLAVFPGNLKEGSQLIFRNPLTGKTHKLPKKPRRKRKAL